MVKTMVERIPGTVTWMNCCHREAPSREAASYRSAGMACIAAR
ncbi:hypothetical protein STENM36S_03262 [Streptomyces tendae]